MTRDVPQGSALVVLGAAAAWMHALPLVRAARLVDSHERARRLRRQAWHVLGVAWGVVIAGVGARFIVAPDPPAGG